MKVCTDACIFGAYIDVSPAKNVLDIGTGTGLLSLMMAQRSNAPIFSIEIDNSAFHQAVENIASSPWHSQIEVVHADVSHWFPDSSTKFDLIVSNPPFFQDYLKSPGVGNNKAKHNDTLSLQDLVQTVGRLLAPEGIFYVLLPPFELELFKNIAQNEGLHLHQKLDIHHNAEKPVFRQIGIFSFQKPAELKSETLYIYENGEYSPAFKQLLGAYYLIFP